LKDVGGLARFDEIGEILEYSRACMRAGWRAKGAGAGAGRHLATFDGDFLSLDGLQVWGLTR